MARFVYAKIYCDILRHPLLRSRPDCDARLALGLILEAREHTLDGVLRNLTAADAKELCHIKAPVVKVQAGIDYLVSVGWLIQHTDQAYKIKDFVVRQGKTDSPEAQSERSQRYYDSHRETILAKRKVSRKKSDGLTRENMMPSHADGEVEEEVEEEGKATEGGEPENSPGSSPAGLTLLPKEPPTPLLAYLAAEFPQAKADPANEKAWAEAFPGVDLLAESKNARRWELDNPTLIKTQKRRFLGNWFAKAQNTLRPSRGATAPARGAANLQISPDLATQSPGRKFL